MPGTRKGSRAFMGRGNMDQVNAVLSKALNVGGATPFSAEFKMGHGWYALFIHIAVVVTIGTGTTPLSDGLLRFVRKVMFKTDRGELICNEGARFLWYLNQVLYGVKPQITTLAASSGTYDIYFALPFCDPNMLRPEDTILDTSRYQSVDLEITTGSTADLFGTPGTSSVTATIDVDIEKSFGALPDKAKPVYFVQYDHRPPVDVSVKPDVELEKSPDLAIKRIISFTGDTGSAGVPWSGAANDTYPVRTNLQDQDRYIIKEQKHGVIQARNKKEYSLETQLAGIEVLDFVRDGSITAALSTADKSSLQFVLTQSGAAANSIMTVSTEGVRLLK